MNNEFISEVFSYLDLKVSVNTTIAMILCNNILQYLLDSGEIIREYHVKVNFSPITFVIQ